MTTGSAVHSIPIVLNKKSLIILIKVYYALTTGTGGLSSVSFVGRPVRGSVLVQLKHGGLTGADHKLLNTLCKVIKLFLCPAVKPLQNNRTMGHKAHLNNNFFKPNFYS